MTGAGMMDCKKALVEAEGDFTRAQEIIREKGKLVAAKRADRETTEGAVKARVADGKGILVCLGCETDFVSPECRGFRPQARHRRCRHLPLAREPTPVERSRLPRLVSGERIEDAIPNEPARR